MCVCVNNWWSESLTMCGLLGKTSTNVVTKVLKHSWQFKVRGKMISQNSLCRCILERDLQIRPPGGRWSGKLNPPSRCKTVL